MRATNFPIVLERETSGAISAFVPGLPVYAAADTQAKAETAIRDVLAAYLEAHPGAQPTARVRVARAVFSARVDLDEPEDVEVSILSAAALIGSMTSAEKKRSSRENGKLGGRPRKVAARA